MRSTLTTKPHLKALRASDFVGLAKLSTNIWLSIYTDIISREQIDYMLAKRNHPDELRKYLNATDRWLMLLRMGNKLIGYCSYSLSDSTIQMKLEQLYLLPEFRGQGLGRFMLHHIEEQVRKHGLEKLTLQTNKMNHAAIAFYLKSGFIIFREDTFDIGGGFVMDDYMMEKCIKSQ